MIRSCGWVALGSALGGVARVMLSQGFNRRGGTVFPLGTFVVNMAGCFLIGLFWGWTEGRFRWGPGTRLFLMAGFCGGFTTFSTYALEITQLLKGGTPLMALLYAGASAVLGVGLFWIGTVLGQ